MKERLDQPGTGLSGGQQQRLCIACAIAVSPEVILMDEPCSAPERIGDHAKNTCEQVVYLVEGADIRHGHEGALKKA